MAGPLVPSDPHGQGQLLVNLVFTFLHNDA